MVVSDKKTSPILITGAQRSGVTMTAHLLSVCGVFGGCPHSKRRQNLYENPYIRSFVTDWFREIRVDERGQYPLPQRGDVLKIKADLQSIVEQQMRLSGYVDGPWFYKDTRTALMWSKWVEAFPKAKWVIVRRPTEELVYSCMRTGFMDAFQDWNGWTWWVNQYRSRFKEIHLAGRERVREIWPHKFVSGQYKEVMDLLGWLGLEWKETQIKAIVKSIMGKTGVGIGQGLKRP